MESLKDRELQSKYKKTIQKFKDYLKSLFLNRHKKIDKISKITDDKIAKTLKKEKIKGWITIFKATKFGKAARIARELSRGIKEATKYGDIRVPESYFYNPESVYRVTSSWERTTLQQMGQSTRADNSPIIHLVRAHDPYYIKERLFDKNPENWVWTDDGNVKIDWRKKLKEVGIHKDAGHDHNVYGLKKGRTFYDSKEMLEWDVILEADGIGKRFRVGHHKNYSKPVEFSEDMAEANPDYKGRKTPPLALRDKDPQIPSKDFKYFVKMPDGTFKYEGRIWPEKREYVLGRDYTVIPTLDEAIQEATYSGYNPKCKFVK